MNPRDYIAEALKQLKDTNYYQELPRSTSIVNFELISNMIDNMYQSGEIGKKSYK